MHWGNIEQIINYFDIESSSHNIKEVKTEIKKRISKLHPDKNSQQQLTNKQKNIWRKLMSAKEFIDNKNNNQLINISELPALFKALNTYELVPTEIKITNIKREDYEVFHRKNAPYKIGSGVFAAITGFLFTFSGALDSHPLLSGYLSSVESQILLLILMFYSGVFFILTWRKERKQEEKISWLNSTQGIKETLIRILKKKGNDEYIKITASEITNEIMNQSKSDYSVSEKIALIQIELLIERGVLIESKEENFEKIYTMIQKYRETLLNENA